MNTIAGEFASVYADDNELLESTAESVIVTAAPQSEPMKAKPLHGYDTAMRDHAAACEAGR